MSLVSTAWRSRCSMSVRSSVTHGSVGGSVIGTATGRGPAAHDQRTVVSYDGTTAKSMAGVVCDHAAFDRFAVTAQTFDQAMKTGRTGDQLGAGYGRQRPGYRDVEGVACLSGHDVHRIHSARRLTDQAVRGGRFRVRRHLRDQHLRCGTGQRPVPGPAPVGRPHRRVVGGVFSGSRPDLAQQRPCAAPPDCDRLRPSRRTPSTRSSRTPNPVGPRICAD